MNVSHAGATRATGTLRFASQPADAGRQTVVDSILGRVDDRARQRITDIVKPLPSRLLQELSQHGLRIDIGEPRQNRAGSVIGQYDLRSRHIIFNGEVLFSEQGPQTVLHEIWHAVEHMRERTARSSGARDAAEDARALKLHDRYQARCALQDAMRMRELVKSDFRGRPHVKFTLRDGFGERDVEYVRADGREIFDVHDRPKRRSALGATVTGAALGAAIGGLPGALVGGVLGAIFGGGGRQRDQNDGETDSTPRGSFGIDTDKGEAAVEQKGMHTFIVLPENGRVKQDDPSWSAYAYRARDVHEYTAEAYSSYLLGGDAASSLEKRDPEMYQHVASVLSEEFAGG
jgi:hypothetical protein